MKCSPLLRGRPRISPYHTSRISAFRTKLRVDQYWKFSSSEEKNGRNGRMLGRQGFLIEIPVCRFCPRSHLPRPVHPHINYPVHIAVGRRDDLYCKLHGGRAGRKWAGFGLHIQRTGSKESVSQNMPRTLVD